jgi:hypothetical protein
VFISFMEIEILPRDFAEILCIYVVWWENEIALGPGPGKTPRSREIRWKPPKQSEARSPVLLEIKQEKLIILYYITIKSLCSNVSFSLQNFVLCFSCCEFENIPYLTSSSTVVDHVLVTLVSALHFFYILVE